MNERYRIFQQTTHEMRTTVLLDGAQLQEIIADRVADIVGFSKKDPSVTIEVKIEPNMEGSPAYQRGHKAKVIIVKNMATETDNEPPTS